MIIPAQNSLIVAELNSEDVAIQNDVREVCVASHFFFSSYFLFRLPSPPPPAAHLYGFWLVQRFSCPQVLVRTKMNEVLAARLDDKSLANLERSLECSWAVEGALELVGSTGMCRTYLDWFLVFGLPSLSRVARSLGGGGGGEVASRVSA